MKNKSLYILLVFLLWVSRTCGQGTLSVTLSSNQSIIYSTQLPDNNTADVTILTQDVILQANIEGKWKKSGESISATNTVTFELITLNIAGLYEFYTMESGLSALQIRIQISVTGVNIAEFTPGEEYKVLFGNEVLYTDTTLACATSGTSEPSWEYKEVQTDTYMNQQPTSWDSTTGISTLTITITKQGYYMCIPIAGESTYTVAIFNPDVTVEATTPELKAFTKGIDSSLLQLLCRSFDNGVPLDEIKWTSTLNPTLSIPNPLRINTLRNGNHYLRCNRGSDTPINHIIIVQGPAALTITDTSSISYTMLPPMTNTADITVFSQNVKLEVNLVTQNSLGRWVTSHSPEIKTSPTTISEFTVNLAGLYQFYVKNFQGTEELAIQIQISVTGSNFAELTSSNEYTLLSGNNIFYTDTTLVCATSGVSEPSWEYKAVQTDTYMTQLSTSWDNTTGISTLTIATTQLGYYMCTPIAGETTYTVAIINPDVTVEVTTSEVNQFTRGIDSSQLQLLCRSSDTNIPLDDVQWTSQLNIQNPFTVSTLSNGIHRLQCNMGSHASFIYSIIVQGPPTLMITDTSSRSYTMLPPVINIADITVFSQNVKLEVNLVTENNYGRWITPHSPEITNFSTTLSEFTANLAGLYQFYVKNSQDTEELAIQIQISVTGSNFAELTSSNEYTLLSGNNIFYTDTTLVCVTSDTSVVPVWSYRETQQARLLRPTGVNWDATMGISTLDIVTTQQGYYTCAISSDSYSIAIFNPDFTTIATNGKKYTYTRGIYPTETQLLCTTNSNTALSNIRWGIMDNPLILGPLQDQNITLVCTIVYPSSIVLQVGLLIQGPPVITLSTTSTSDTYTNLPNLHDTNTADIMVLSQDVTLQANLEGKWQLPGGSSVTRKRIEIQLFTKILAGTYEFYTTSLEDTEVLAIQIEIAAIGSNFAELTSSNEFALLSGNNIFYTNTALVCVTSDTSVVPVWSYRETQTGSENPPTGVNWDVTTGISTLDIVTTQQGYYTCAISSHSYNVAIFNPDFTTIATDDQDYTYIKDIDSSEIQLLCTTTDSNIALSDIKWGSLDNPLLLNSAQNQDTTTLCRVSVSTTILSVNLVIQGPPEITLSISSDTISTHLLTVPDTNSVDITVLSKNVVLQSNLKGRWERPDGSLVAESMIEFELFTKDLAGVYKFHVTSWSRSEVIAIQIELTAVDTNLAEVSQGIYNILSGNDVFLDDKTLACATSGTLEPQWSYKAVQTNTYTTQSATSWDSTTGISTLTITTTQQGYYTCTPIAEETTYTVAIFNIDVTVEVTTSDVNQFTRGIDSSLLQLLCRSSDINIPLDDVQWTSILDSQLNIPNPFIVSTLNNGFHRLKCNRGSDTSFTYMIVVQGPPTLTVTDTSSISYTMLPPMINTTDITVFSQNVKLEVNLVTQNSLGRWVTPLSPEITDLSTTISEFTANLAGLYQFYVINFISAEELAIQIQISVIGSNFAELTSSNEYTLLSGNNIFYTDTTLVCVTSDTSIVPVWKYRNIEQDSFVRATREVCESSIGICTLNIVTTQQGYYICTVSGDSYETAILNRDVTTIATDGQDYTYTKDIDSPDTQLLCNTTDSNTALSDIKWGSLNNPLVLNSAQNQDTTTLCTVSASTTILSVNLVIQGPPVITLLISSNIISTHSLTFSDTNSAGITVLSKNVVLESNLKGRWELPDGSSVYESMIEFELFTKESLAGVYKFYVTNWSKSEVIAIQIEIFAIGTNLAEIPSQGIYDILSGNEVFFDDTKLACATSGTSQPQWMYKAIQTDNYMNRSATSWDPTTGISTLTITTTQQGYYTCTPIAGGTTYTVAIFNPDDTVEVTTSGFNAFTKEIDSSLLQLQLLCRSSDNTVPLDDIRWTSTDNPTLSILNPSIINTLNNANHNLRCTNGGDTPIDYTITVQGPPTLTITDTSSRSYTMLPPMNNTVDITVFSLNVKLEVNLVTQNNLGRWKTPLSPEITDSSTTISEFTINLAGLYKFYVKTIRGGEEKAIQIRISTTGSNFAELTSSNEYILLSGNNIFYTDTTLVCATSDTSVVPVWAYRETQQGSGSTPTGVTWDDSAGISKLSVATTEQGYYTCTITGESVYNIAIFNDDSTTIATDGKKYTYTRGVYTTDTQLLCTTDSNTALSSIRWGLVDNPLILDPLQNQDTTLDCRIISQSPIVLQVDLLIQGPPVITLSTTSDTYTNLPNSSDTNTADIMILSQDVTLQANLEGRWQLPGGSSVTGKLIEIKLFTKNLAGIYEFYTAGLEDTEVLAIQIEITAIGGKFAEITSQTEYSILSGNEMYTTSTKLACITSGTSQPQWMYKAVQTDTYVNQQPISWDSDTGISTLTITTTQQGYYTCTPIAGGITYTVAIFNPDVTVEVTTQELKAFTRGIDSPLLQLLCRSSDTNVSLDDIQWTSQLDSQLNIQNPSIVSTLSDGFHRLQCNRGSDTSFIYSIIVQGPPTLTITDTSSRSYTRLPLMINTADITVFSQNVKLEVNLVTQNNLGRWVTPLSLEITDSSTTISEFTTNLAGLYEFYVKNFISVEELAIQIQISVTGSNFAELTSSNDYTLLSGNNIFYSDTALFCVTSDTSREPVWSYRETQQGRLMRPTGVIWNANTGISTLDILTTKQGYYTCITSRGNFYNAAIFNPDITTSATDGQDYTYTKDIDSSDTQLLCNTTDSNIALSDIKWGSLNNPLVLNSAQNRDTTTLCRVSASTTILSVHLTIQGPPVITLLISSNIISAHLLTFSDTNSAGITVLSQNVVLQSNLKGRWELPDGSSVYESMIEFELFTKESLAGVYKFHVTSWSRSEVIAIQIEISAIGTSIGIKKDSIITPISSNTILYRETTTLVAASNKTSLEPGDVVWSYQGSFEESESITNETNNDLTRSISILDLNTKADGYYSVSIKDSNSDVGRYIVGIFNDEMIYDTTVNSKIKYTSGIDSDKLKILCIPPDDNSGLENIKWTDGSVNFPNPVTLEEVVSVINNPGNLTLHCVDNTNEVYSIVIGNQDLPIITLSYYGTIFSTSGIKDEKLFHRNVPVFTSNVKLECNKDPCRWTRANGTLNTTNTPHIINYLAINNDGVYVLETQNNKDMFQESLRINLIAVGTAFLTVKGDGIYDKLENNSIIDMIETIMLACVTSYKDSTENGISWYFQENSDSSRVKIIDGFVDAMGVSVYYANKPGYYHCDVKDHEGNLTNYSAGLLALSKDTVLISFSNEKPREFTINDPLQYYYQDPDIPITAIRWGIGPVDDEESDREFYNPVNISDVFNKFGSGVFQLSCFYRQSPVTIEGNFSLNMRDKENVTVEYGSTSATFSDLTNDDLSTPQKIDIAILTKNVTISCSSPPCEVQSDNTISEIDLEIDSIRIENNGTYSLRRTTQTGNNYTTAKFDIIVTGFIEQIITKLNATVINDTSINIAWDLQNILPDNAEETFNVTYQRDGNELVIAGVTQGDSFNITGLVAGVTYTVWVELSYTYTFAKPKSTIRVLIPSPNTLLIPIVIVIVVVLILLLVVIVVILIILYIWKIRGKNDKKFTTLSTDENEPKMKVPVHSSRDFEYEQIPAIDNLAYNPVLTESLPKFNQSASRDSRNYQNLHDAKDSRMKPIPLELYKKTIDELWEDENALENEYKSLGGETLRYECSFAQIDQNRIKNKYKFIYPYDKSRVVLKKIGKDVHSDYINASNIPGMYVDENFIAAQGPKVNTIADIWRMVFELKIVNIVMVTNCVEGGKLKCEEYFAMKEGRTHEYAEYKVKTTSLTQYVGHITRVLKVQSPKESIQVKHFHFTAWPDHDVPSLHDELLQFIGYVQDNITQSDTPILVHCSAGVGRTGTFITLFNLRAAILRRQPISIYHLVHEMREHRPHMVQTYRQYKFIYLAVLELLLENTSIPADEFSSTYQNYLQSDQTGYVSVFFQQFSELNYQCEKSFEYATDIGEDNEEKNPIPNILPYDNNRVVIYSPYFDCGYINASYHENNLFITTQHPTENTLLDFLQMIYQTEATLVVMLTTAKEKAKIQGNMIDRKAYWPSKDVPLEVPPFQVEVVNSEKSTAMIKQKVILRNLKENSERVFTQAVSTSWTERSDITDVPSILNLIHLVLNHRQESPNSTIIMHCTDSISKTGVMFTVYQSIKEMKRTGKIDMFHTVKRLRRERMKLIPNLTQYLACYSLMNEYCSST